MSIKIPTPRVRALVAILLAAGLAACAARATVNRILAEPQRYANDEVQLTGRVVRAASLLGRGAYQLDDGTGTIWVVSQRGVPREGARVKVKGTVRDAYDIGSIVKLPDVARSGLVLIEKEHKAAD